ncbi:MAG: hypothetical protein ACOYWZ_12050 [Bacillota bacterium]
MKRPGGVTALSVTLLVFGFLQLLLCLIMIISPGEESISTLNLMVITSIFLFLTGIGMLLGKRWGWWLSVCFLSVLFTSFLTTFITNSWPKENFYGDDLLRAFAMFILTGFCLTYLFNKNVLEYFLLANYSKVKLATLPLCLSLALLLITAINIFK